MEACGDDVEELAKVNSCAIGSIPGQPLSQELIAGGSPEFSQLLLGLEIPCEFEFPASPPDWLDKDLFDVGIQFYHRNMVGILASNGEALIMGLALPTFYKPLAFSGVTSKKKRAALMRYVETGKHIYGRWYRGKPWEEASSAAESLKIVNKMHKHVADMIKAAADDFEEKINAEFVGCQVEGEQAKILKEELAELRKTYAMPDEYFSYINSKQAFSQFDMTLVQAAFFAAVIIYPEHYGSNTASAQELEGFIHVWRVFGYYMGISDSNNAAQFGLERDIVAGNEVMEKILKPCMLNVNDQSMIMAQKIFSNPLDYYVWVYRDYKMVGFKMDKLWASFTWRQCFLYYTRSLFLDYLYPLPVVRTFMNYWTNKIIIKMWSKEKIKNQ